MDNEQITAEARAELLAQGLTGEQVDNLIALIATQPDQAKLDHEEAVKIYNRMMGVGDNGWADPKTHKKQGGGTGIYE